MFYSTRPLFSARKELLTLVEEDGPHKISIGALVELKSGTRLFVVCRYVDSCNYPLYSLAPDKSDTELGEDFYFNSSWSDKHEEEDLVVIEESISEQASVK